MFLGAVLVPAVLLGTTRDRAKSLYLKSSSQSLHVGQGGPKTTILPLVSVDGAGGRFLAARCSYQDYEDAVVL